MNLAEAVKLGPGMPVKDLHCVVARAFPARTATTQYGVKTVLDGIFSDGNGTELRLTWWNPTYSADQLAGQQVVISAGTSKDNKLVGAVLKQGRDKDGHPRLELSISDNRLVLASELTDAVTPQAAAASRAPATAAAPSPAPPPMASGGKLRESDLYALAQRAANRMTECFIANSVPLDAPTLGALMSTVIIAATRGALTLEPNEEDAPPF